MLKRGWCMGNMDNNSDMGHEFWLSPIGLQLHISETAVKDKWDRWDLELSAEVLDNVILLVARFGDCIGYLYLGATVNTMYKLYQSLGKNNELHFICVVTDKKKRYVQYMRRFFLKEELVKVLLGALNTFLPVTEEYMANMNESRQPHELICKKMLEKAVIKLDSR